ncbi:MAG: hypothetical protein ACP5KW_09155 [Thermoproteota archaeon]|jgi:hypothetical protein
MAKVLGSGVGALQEFIRKCETAGGVPIIRTKYGGRPLKNNRVIVACWGAREEAPGGTIENVPPDVIATLQKERGAYKKLVPL